MRALDFYLGIPILFFLSFVDKVWSPMNRTRSKRSAVVIFKLFGLGSVALTRPAVKFLKKQQPETDIFFVTFEGNRDVPLLAELLDRDHVLLIRTSSIGHLWCSSLRALRILRKRRIQISLDLEYFSRFTMLFSYLAGARRRFGYVLPNVPGFYRGTLLTDCILYNPYVHTARSYMSFVEKLTGQEADQVNDYAEQIASSSVETDFVKSIVIPREHLSQDSWSLIVINVNAGPLMLERRWQGANFIRLTNLLLSYYPKARVIFIGAAAERTYIQSLWPGIEQSERALDVSGLLDIK